MGTLGMAIIGLPAARAQDVAGLPRIAVLGLSAPSDQTQAFEEGLRALGHANGATVAITYRSAEGREDLLPSLASEIVALVPKVIVAIGTKAALAAQQATKDLPIVAVTGDIVAAGIVKNLARPEGNVTGLSFLIVDLTLKRLELLLELAPRIRRLTVLGSGRPTPSVEKVFLTLDAAARRKGLDVRMVTVERIEDVGPVLGKLRGGADEGYLVMPTPDFDARAVQIGRLTAEQRLIAILPWKEYVQAGGLIAYAPDIVALWRHASTYVDRILRGAKPGDLPIEQPTKFELLINVRTARLLGLTVPPSLLLRTDRLLD
jgi:putative ABC transport system substrate-binding protein